MDVSEKKLENKEFYFDIYNCCHEKLTFRMTFHASFGIIDKDIIL